MSERQILKRQRVVSHPVGETRTKQSMRDEVNANTIVRRYQQEGVLPIVLSHKPSYGDFTNEADYMTALSRVRAAEADFARLPAHIRGWANNDAGQFLDQVLDPELREQVEKLGLGELADRLHGEREPEPEPVPVPEPDPEPEPTP